MTYAPQPLLDARAYLAQQTGLPWVSLGIVGGPGHDGGYHCGWDRRRIRNGRLADYSWQESTRDSGHRTDAASALDVGNFPRLRELSVWLVRRCQAGASDCRDIRSIIYSPDGRVVRRWDRLGVRSTGDSTHLTHTHISYFRDSEHRSKVAPFRAFFEEDDVSAREVWDEPLQRPEDGEPRRAGDLLRWGNHAIYQTRDSVRTVASNQRAILAQLAGEDVVAAVRAELDRHRGVLLAEVAEQLDGLGGRLAEALPDVPAEQVRAAVAAELAGLRLVAEPGGQEPA